MGTFRILGACCLTVGLLAAGVSAGPRPLESPDEEDCFEWTYPKKDACGKLSGKTECKSEPSIEASDDEAKKRECKPTKGDDCFCD